MQETLTNPAPPDGSWLPILLATLRARGVTFVLKGNALKVRPWKLLTAGEAAAVQANRTTLKTLVRTEGPSKPPAEIVEPTSTSQVVPPEPTCPYCYTSPADCAAMKTDRPDVWPVLHSQHPDEIARRDREATEVMRAMVGEGITWHR